MNRLRARLSLVAAFAVLAVAGCASSATSSGTAGGAAPTTPISTPPVASTVPASPVPSGLCAWTLAENNPALTKTGVPPVSPPHAGTATMTIVTNQGDIVIKTDRKATPCTVASFAYLGATKFFNNTPCHRLTTDGIFVLQCGDPTGTGSGGPSYTIPDENLPANSDGSSINYARGTIAMANTGEPNSGSSQFFLVYKDSPLPPTYTKFGTVTKGLDILDKIAAAGVVDGSADGHPKLPVTIQSLTVTAN